MITDRSSIRLTTATLFLAGILSALAQPAPGTAPAAPVPNTATSGPAPAANELVSVQFPKNSINDVLLLYEMLTGKKLIRDSKLEGPELTLMVPGRLPKEDAIRLIEAAMLLNGYTIVPVDDLTVKILGPGKTPQGEGIPLFVDPDQLPRGDQVVSYFMTLRFLSPQDAETTFKAFVKFNPFGNILAVPNANAVVITEKTPVIQRLISLQKLIDVPPAQVTTQFITLQRADAEQVVTILDTIFKKNESSTPSAPAQPIMNRRGMPPAMQAAAEAAANGGAQYEKRILSGEAQFAADPRTNRILIVARNEDFLYIRGLVEQFDAAVEFDEPLERPLSYVKASDVLPVLANMIAETSEEQKETGNDQNTGNTRESLLNSGSTGGGMMGGMGGGRGSSMSSLGSNTMADKIRDPEENSAPQSRIVGKTRLIADNASNTIVVIGPPESRKKVASLLDILDRKPMQVYLSTVIGQLRLGEGVNYGVDYLVKYTKFSPNAKSGMAGSLLNKGTDILPDPSTLNAPDLFSNLAGLTFYGVIADSVDIYARLLESSNRFRVLSRPVVYTTNNKKAVISSGQNVPVPSSTLTNVTPGLSGQAVTSNIEYIPVVLKLEVVPLVNSDREVTLVISQQNNNIVGQQTISENTVPIIGTQEVTTTVTAQSGNTVVLGGLITEEKTNDRQGIPYLNRIPIVGGLFGDISKNRTRNELIVLIQPTVIASDKEALKGSWDERARSALGDDAMEMAQPTPSPGKKGMPFSTP